MPVIMHATDASIEMLDELTQVQLSVAKRADDLSRASGGESAGRDFWREAESEVWAARAVRRGGGGERPVAKNENC